MDNTFNLNFISKKILILLKVIIIISSLLTFLRFSNILGVFIPRKIIKAFSDEKLLEEFDLKNISSQGLSPIVIDKNIQISNRLRFHFYPSEIVRKRGTLKKGNIFLQYKSRRHRDNIEVLSSNKYFTLGKIK